MLRQTYFVTDFLDVTGHHLQPTDVRIGAGYAITADLARG